MRTCDAQPDPRRWHSPARPPSRTLKETIAALRRDGIVPCRQTRVRQRVLADATREELFQNSTTPHGQTVCEPVTCPLATPPCCESSRHHRGYQPRRRPPIRRPWSWSRTRSVSCAPSRVRTSSGMPTGSASASPPRRGARTWRDRARRDLRRGLARGCRRADRRGARAPSAAALPDDGNREGGRDRAGTPMNTPEHGRASQVLRPRRAPVTCDSDRTHSIRSAAVATQLLHKIAQYSRVPGSARRGADPSPLQFITRDKMPSLLAATTTPSP
jgi:hypothetical protein